MQAAFFLCFVIDSLPTHHMLAFVAAASGFSSRLSRTVAGVAVAGDLEFCAMQGSPGVDCVVSQLWSHAVKPQARGRSGLLPVSPEGVKQDFLICMCPLHF